MCVKEPASQGSLSTQPCCGIREDAASLALPLLGAIMEMKQVPSLSLSLRKAMGNKSPQASPEPLVLNPWNSRAALQVQAGSGLCRSDW